MLIECYFMEDDGSLPEVEVQFSEPSAVVRAFTYLFTCGARNITVGGPRIWVKATKAEREFAGSQDSEQVISGVVEPFHVVLGSINFCGVILPDIGVWIDPSSLTLDYRMGSEWGQAEIQAFFNLLRQLKQMGASISVPWWGAKGELAFRQAVSVSPNTALQPTAYGGG